jgi:hypothetical protein
MDFGHVRRLDASRRSLAEGLAAADQAEAEQAFAHDQELAEPLLPALEQALESLQELYDDEDLWERAESIAKSLPSNALERVDGYNDTLSALLELFGYRVPPPPPAQQLVSAAIAGLHDAGDAGSSAEEVAEARDALRDLLHRGRKVAKGDPPWLVKPIVHETNQFLETGIEVAAGAGGAAVGFVVSTALVAGAVGGIGVLAGALVVGGARHLKKSRTKRKYADELARERQLLHGGLLRAAQAAVLQHVDQILALHSDLADSHDPLTALQLRDHLDALVDVARNFVRRPGRLTAQTNQAELQGNGQPRAFLRSLVELYPVAAQAAIDLSTTGSIASARISGLKSLRVSIIGLQL